MNFSNYDVMKLNKAANEYMQKGEYDKAAARLEAIIELNPEFFEAYYNLGIAYYQMEEYEKSINALDKATEKKNDFADAYYAKAVAFEDLAENILHPDNDIEDEDENTNEENEPKISDEDKAKATEYLNLAVENFEKYLELKPNCEEKEDINKKIAQLKDDINNNFEEN